MSESPFKDGAEKVDLNQFEGSSEDYPDDSSIVELDVVHLNKIIEDIGNNKSSKSDRFEAISNASLILLPILAKEAFNNTPNVDKSIVVARYGNLLKDLAKILQSRFDADVSDTLDPKSLKFQTVFGWFIDLIKATMMNVEISEDQMDKFFNEFAVKLVSWEDRVEKSTTGISYKALDKASNPFFDEFKKKLDPNLEG